MPLVTLPLMRKAVAALIAALITGCASTGQPVATLAVFSPTPGLATLALPSPTPSAAPSAPTAPPTFRTPVPITDVTQVFTSSGSSGWRPGGTTLVIGSTSASGATTLVALQLGPRNNIAPPVSLVTFVPGAWSLRADGGALAVSVTRTNASRIAIWDMGSGSARWLTAGESGAAEASPVWSKDGGSIYYMSSEDGKGSGIYQIGADGSGKRLIKAADDRTGPPEGLTPDGQGLIWSRGQAGGSVEILDIATGVSRHLEDVARVVSWRSRQPRALLMVGGCCAGRPGGSLVAWDDTALTSRVVAELGQNGDPAWGAGAWDPTGTRIAAVRFDNASPYEGALVIIDPATAATQPIAGTEGAGNVQWLAEGIVFSIQHVRQPAAELMFLPSGTGPAVSLVKTGGLQGVTVVRP
jgi:hypothetical protein